MKVLFYVNCLNWSIRYYLSKKYKDIEYDEIPTYQFVGGWDDKDPWEINEEQLKWADVFIYQKMDKKFGIRSTDPSIEYNMLTHLRPDCIKISIPYIYNDVNWITFPPAIGDGNVGGWGDTSRHSNSESILKLKRRGYSLKQIQDLHLMKMMDWDIPGRVKKYYDELDRRDETLDVKSSDFIKEHIRNHQLFFTQNHPTSILPGHLSNQIFEILGTSHRDDPFGHPLTVTHIHGGSYTHSLYDQKFWNFKFPVKYSDELFLPVIKKIYESYN